MSRFDASTLARAAAALARRLPAKPAEPKAVAVAPAETTSSRDLAERIACELAKKFEGLILSPYLCPAGVPTIGYGATSYADGRRVRLTDPPISREAAERLLLLEVRRLLPLVQTACPGITTEKRLGAITDYTFNLGFGRLLSSTMRKRINSGAWGDVPTELRKWVMGGGKKLSGLVRRREAEIRYIGS